MVCEQNKLRISLYLDGELPQEEAEALRAHLESCEGCTAYMAELQTAVKALKQLPQIEVSRSFDKRLGARLRRDSMLRLAPSITVHMWYRRVLAAAVAVVVLAVGVLIISFATRRHGVEIAPRGDDTPVTRRTPETKTPKVRLPRKEESEEAKQSDEVRPHGPEPVKPVEVAQEPGEHVRKDVPEKHREPKPEDVAQEPRKSGPPSDTVTQQPEAVPPQKLVKDEPVQEPPDEKLLAEIEALEKEFSRLLKESNLEKQLTLVRDLGLSSNKHSHKVLKKILTSKSKKVQPSVRREALSALAEIGTKDAVGVMLCVVEASDWEVRDAVPEAMSRIRRPETVKWLAAEVLATSQSPQVRKIVAEALGRVGQEVPQQPLAEALGKEKETRVRIAICETLGIVGDSESEDALIDALRDKSWLVRETALRALARVGTMKCTSEVIRLLNDKSPLVKEAAAIALSKTPDVRALEPLVKLLKHKDIRLHGAVLTALWRISGKEFMKESQWRAWLKETGPFPETNLNPEAAPPAPSSFFKVPLWTNSVVYLVDEETVGRRGFGKFREVKRLIKESVSQLPKETRFNVIFFGTGTRSLSYKSLLRADRRTKTRAAEWLDKLQPIYISRIDFYGLLTAVLKMRPDDIILVTDNVPNAGHYVYPPKVVHEITEKNLYQKTRIHSFGFYTVPNKEMVGNPFPVGRTVDFLRDLSARNYGQFKYRWFRTSRSDNGR